MKTDFVFHRVVVVADGPNVFSEQLEKRQIPYTLQETIPGYADPPDLVLVVNKNLQRSAEPLKKRYPDAQVIHCQGGHKNFSPRITVVHGQSDHDVCWFSSWDDFIELIGRQLERQQRVFLPSHGKFHYRALETPRCPDTRAQLQTAYAKFLRMSETYLTWYIEWLDEVSKMHFECSFKVSKNRRVVKRLIVKNDGTFVHKGLPVFQEETMVSFFCDDGSEHFGMVISANEEELVVHFALPVKPREANSFVSFTRDVDQEVPKIQRELCWNVMSRESIEQSPLSVIAGISSNEDASDAWWLKDAQLSDENARRISQDDSQALALARVTDRRWVSIVQGPAGTGKTFLTSLAVQQFYRKARIILLVSHSNQGLDNLLSFVAKTIEHEAAIFRLGNNLRNISESGKCFHRTKKYGGISTTSTEPSESEVRDMSFRLKFGGNVVIACTMTSFLIDHTMARLRQEGFKADVAIVDEASRGFFHELLPVLDATRGRVMFVGDPDQLGNIGISPDARQYLSEGGFSGEEIRDFTDGWFAAVIKKGLLPVDLLRINRRSLPVICEIVSRMFYDGRLISGRFDPDHPGKYEFHDTSSAEDAHDEQIGTSWVNRREANLVVKQIVKLLERGVPLTEIGVITPYRAQILLIRHKLRGELLFNKRLAELRKKLLGSVSVEILDQLDEETRTSVFSGFDEKTLQMFMGQVADDVFYPIVNTVDAFQGSQRKVIILSMVRSNNEGAIGFNSNVNRLRVAFSRAEDRLIVISSSRTFLSCDVPEVRCIFQQLLDYARELGTYREIA